jgi:hypothetical protein
MILKRSSSLSIVLTVNRKSRWYVGDKNSKTPSCFQRFLQACALSLNVTTHRTAGVDMIPVPRSWDRSRRKEKKSQASTNLPPSCSAPHPSLSAVVGDTNHTEWARARQGWILLGRRRVDSERRSVRWYLRRLCQQTSSNYSRYETNRAAVWCVIAGREDALICVSAVNWVIECTSAHINTVLMPRFDRRNRDIHVIVESRSDRSGLAKYSTWLTLFIVQLFTVEWFKKVF